MPMKVRYTVVDGEILSENRNGVLRDYVPDGLGSTVALLDSSQTKTDTFSYWPYGERAGRTGTTATPFEYGGTLGYYKDTSARTYVRARHLSTQHTRWMTQDPIGFKGGDYNLYRYVRNSPIQLSDTSGLQIPCQGEPLAICTQQCRPYGISTCFMYPELQRPDQMLPPFSCICRDKCDFDLMNCRNAANALYILCMAAHYAELNACKILCKALPPPADGACNDACVRHFDRKRGECKKPLERRLKDCQTQYKNCCKKRKPL